MVCLSRIRLEKTARYRRGSGHLGSHRLQFAAQAAMQCRQRRTAQRLPVATDVGALLQPELHKHAHAPTHFRVKDKAWGHRRCWALGYYKLSYYDALGLLEAKIEELKALLDESTCSWACSAQFSKARTFAPLSMRSTTRLAFLFSSC